MTAPQAKSIASDLDVEINDATKAAPRHLSPTDARVIEWDERLRKLEGAIPELGALLRAQWYALQGDVVGMEGAIATARKVGALPEHVLIVQTVSYSNLGFGTKGLNAYRRAIDIKNFNVTMGIQSGVACGAFQRINELVDQARKTQLDLSPLVHLDRFARAKAAIEHQGATDDDCARVVDLAGEVLRAKSLFWLDLAPEILAHGLDDPVVLLMRVDTTASEASQMSLDLVDKLIDSGMAQSPFLVSFVGTRQ